MHGTACHMEIGRKQLVYFCANLLGEQEPDPTMIVEIDEMKRRVVTRVKRRSRWKVKRRARRGAESREGVVLEY